MIILSTLIIVQFVCMFFVYKKLSDKIIKIAHYIKYWQWWIERRSDESKFPL